MAKLTLRDIAGKLKEKLQQGATSFAQTLPPVQAYNAVKSGINTINRITPGGIQGGIQRVQQSFKQPQQYFMPTAPQARQTVQNIANYGSSLSQKGAQFGQQLGQRIQNTPQLRVNPIQDLKMSLVKKAAPTVLGMAGSIPGEFIRGIAQSGREVMEPSRFVKAPLYTKGNILGTPQSPTKAGIAFDVATSAPDVTDLAKYATLGGLGAGIVKSQLDAKALKPFLPEVRNVLKMLGNMDEIPNLNQQQARAAEEIVAKIKGKNFVEMINKNSRNATEYYNSIRGLLNDVEYNVLNPQVNFGLSTKARQSTKGVESGLSEIYNPKREEAYTVFNDAKSEASQLFKKYMPEMERQNKGFPLVASKADIKRSLELEKIMDKSLVEMKATLPRPSVSAPLTSKESIVSKNPTPEVPIFHRPIISQPPLTKGVESMPVNPKGSLNTPRVVDPKTGKILSTPQTGGEISTRTMANQAVSSTPIITEKGKLNLNRLKIKGAAKQVAQDIESGVTPTVIGNKEVIAKARTAKGTSAMTDEQMKNLMAQQLKNRQVVVDLSKKFNQAKKAGADEVELGKIMLEIADQSRTARQGGTFAGRLLQAQNIVADKSASPMQKIIALLDNAGVEESKYLKDSVKVNWDDPREVVAFYRKYVPPKLGEVLDEIRYSNMLSSPLTHITNISSNALQTGVVAPIEKTISGVLDLGKSILSGKERKYYTTAGIDYSVGYVKSLPQAIKKAWNVLSGNEISVRPDFEYVPTGVGGPLQAYTTPLRALEAMDQFFKTLVEGGVNRELTRGPRKMSIPTRAGLAEKEATYRLFRQSFDPNGELGQGVVLQMFDKWNNAISGLRRLPGGKWILPFFQTPTNILKQGVEYSPLGISTAIGAKNPIEQLSKAVIGSTVMMGAYQLASSGLTSWEAPSGEKERELYYAAGMQPYSVKIGDKWVSYSKLGPLSYPIAMAAALAHAEKYNPDKSEVENISKAVGGMLQFFGDQSYVRNIGDLVDAIQGGVNVGPRAISSQAANLVGQLIPYKSFITWLGRMIDPTYRKATTFKDRLVKDIPVLGSGLEPYTDINGKPSMRDLPFLNAVSPLRVTQEKSQMKGMLDEYQNKKIQKAVDKRADDKFADSAKTGEGEVSGNVYRYIDDNGSVKTIDLSFPMPEYKPTGNSILDKELLSDYRGAMTKRKNEVMKAWEVGAIDQNEAIKQLETLVTASNKTKSPKKPKKITLKVSNYKAPKITIKKRSSAKLPTIKFKKPKKTKIVRRYTIK